MMMYLIHGLINTPVENKGVKKCIRYTKSQII
jgi:hypothetical protein